MGRVITNGMSISIAREASPGVLPANPTWFELEPNEINSFGTTIAKTARSPISRSRARRKGSVTDADSNVEFGADFTLAHLRILAEDFCYARAIGADSYLASAAVVGGYTVPALSAAQAGRLVYTAGAKTLIYGRGWNNPQNNGLKVLSGASAGGGTQISAAGVVAEAPAASAVSEVSIAGVRGAAGDITVDADGNLLSTALDFRLLGLSRGQVIHVGGVDFTNQFQNPANYGFARVLVVTQNKVTLSKRDQPFVVDDGTSTGAGGTPIAIDLLFGQFVRNVSVEDPAFVELSSQIELASPNLMPGGLTGFEQAPKAYADALSISIPLSGKATITAGFVCGSTTNPSTVRALNSANAKIGGQTESFGTASDIARLRLQDVDEAGLSTDFKSANFTLTNNVSAEKVLGVLGAKYLNIGNLECDVESQLLFTNPDVIERIRCNKTVGFDFVLRNDDGGVAFDFPTGTINGGGREYPANQSVAINTTFQAHEESLYGYTLGISFFPVLPTTSCG